jgi:endonuclease/exonuclease/phosphatase (EEP) superfamily protein YafD
MLTILSAAPTSLRLLTLNCLWRGAAAARLAAIARWLERSDLDVVCLQEVVVRRRVALLRSLAPSFPHVVHRPFAIGVLGGLVILSRWPVAARRFAVYRRLGRLWNSGWSDRLIRKGYLVTELDAGGRPLVVVNTHLAANYGGDWSPANDYARIEAAELGQLADAVAGLDPALPLVVAGDLNVPAGTWLFDDFVRRTGLRDALDRAGPTWRPASADSGAIDHVLVRGCAVEAAALCLRDPVRLADGRTMPASDHLGIRVSVRLD